MAVSSNNRLDRRRLAVLAAAGLLNRCAAVPAIHGLTGRDVGLSGQPKRDQFSQGKPDTATIDDSDALQQQYDLQRALSDSPIVFGNQVSLLASGADAFEAIFTALKAAKNNINMEYFILADVRSGGMRLSEVLLDRLRAGVKVNMIYNSYRLAQHARHLLRHAAPRRCQGRRVQPDRSVRRPRRLVAKRP